MKIKNQSLLVALFIVFTNLNAQHSFVVQNNGANGYKTLNEAYENASTGDTIYLPGGSFTMPTINKSLVWIGVGYHPDSCKATYFTEINNGVYFQGECDNSFITGIQFNADVQFGVNGDDAVDIQLIRCRVKGNLRLKYDDNIERNIDMLVSECIIDRNVNANLGGNIIIEKSIIRNTLSEFRNSIFDRNVFTLGNRNTSWGYSYTFTGTQNCQIRNSVINKYSYTRWAIDNYDCINNNFIHNIFSGSITFPEGTNTGSDNQTEVDLLTVFETIDEGIENYSYNHNFHLKAGSPAIAAGTGGTDIGLYGGSVPFKDGGLPSAPHVRKVNIENETSEGILQVEIEAGSQEN